jgi:hypothetical protein
MRPVADDWFVVKVFVIFFHISGKAVALKKLGISSVMCSDV